MGSNSRHIQFVDFHPSPEQVNKVTKVINKIQKLMPDDTKVHSVLKYQGKSFKGDLKFQSKRGYFIAQSRGKNIVQLYSRLKNKILKQWRSKKTARINSKKSAGLPPPLSPEDTRAS